MKVTGTYHFEVRDAEGSLKDSWDVRNVVTSAGKAQLALLAGDAAAVPFTYIAVGTSSSTPSSADIALGAEITDSGLQRAAGTVSRTTTSVTNDTYQITKTFSVTGTKTVEEAGVFNAASGPTMLSHALTTTKSLVSGDQFVVTYRLQFS